MAMKRIDVYIREDQFYAVASFKGTLSEHVRRALDIYIETLTPTSAQSKSKESDVNG